MQVEFETRIKIKLKYPDCKCTNPNLQYPGRSIRESDLIGIHVKSDNQIRHVKKGTYRTETGGTVCGINCLYRTPVSLQEK